MSITAIDALKALYHIGESYDAALLAHHMSGRKNEGSTDFHLGELETSFAKAAHALGYRLIKIEANQLHVLAAEEE